jgi:hypothetical protein
VLETMGPEVTRLESYTFTWALQGSSGLSKYNRAIMAHSANTPILIRRIIVYIKRDNQTSLVLELVVFVFENLNTFCV